MKTGNEIKKELKALGFNTKGISVKVSITSINVTIKDLSISSKAVEEHVREYESISRCQYSGEILSGGNTYVFVNYDWEVLSEAKNTSYEVAKALTEFAKKEFGPSFPLYHAVKLAEKNVRVEGFAQEVISRMAQDFYSKHKEELELAS